MLGEHHAPLGCLCDRAPERAICAASSDTLFAVNPQRWGEAFVRDAARYDRTRPGYPSALIDDWMVERPSRVLDVGCGTGKAGRAFVGRGCTVVGVEPDARMAAVADRHGLRIEVARFEDWEPMIGEFDLLVS